MLLLRRIRSIRKISRGLPSRGFCQWRERQETLLRRQTAKPVVFDEFEEDDDDLLVGREKSGRELYDRHFYDLKGDDEEEDYIDSDEEEEMVPEMKVGKELLRLGKVQNRRIEYLPEWVVERKEEISGHRTPRQVRRCVKNWMLKPDRQLQQEYAFKELGWSDNIKADKPLTATKGKGSKDNADAFVYGPEETVAYCNFFFPSRFQITQRVFQELKLIMPKFQPKRVLDLGCGMGTVGACAVDVWGGAGVGVEKYVGIDQSAAMLDAAKIMTSRMGVVRKSHDDKQYVPSSSTRGKRVSSAAKMRSEYGRPVNVALHSKTAECVQRIQRGGDKERYDLAAATYTISELQSDATKRAAIQVLYEALDVNGILVLIDTGSPIGSHSVRTARQYLLDMFQADESSNMYGRTATVKYVLPPPTNPETEKPYNYEDFTVKVLAPCTHDHACPLKPGAWCSFKQKTQSSMIRKASEEKYSYVILQKQLKKSPSEGPHAVENDWTLDPDEVDPARDPTPLATMKRFLEAKGEAEVDGLVQSLIDEVDWDDYHPPLFREEYGRIIRSPLKKKGHVILDTCQADGHLTRSVLSKSEIWQVPALYSALRKLRWGGLVPVLPLQPKDPQEVQEQLMASTDHIIDEDTNNAKKRAKGFVPSSFMTSSPMSRKGISEEAIKKVVPPPVKTGRSSIWSHEGEGPPKKDDRNRHFAGRGGMIMDEAREGLLASDEGDDDDHEDEEEDLSIKKETSLWDEEDEEASDADDLPPEKMQLLSQRVSESLRRMREGDLPSPEVEGKERFFSSSRDDLATSQPSEDGPEADMELLEQLKQSYPSSSELEGGDSIEWDKVFSDLQRDGAFDDIDTSSLEQLEKEMGSFDWTSASMGDDSDSRDLDMDDFARMLEPKSEEQKGSKRDDSEEAARYSISNPVEDDLMEDEWESRFTSYPPGASVEINSTGSKKKDKQRLKQFDDIAKSKLESFKKDLEDSRPSRGRRRRPAPVRGRKPPGHDWE